MSMTLSAEISFMKSERVWMEMFVSICDASDKSRAWRCADRQIYKHFSAQKKMIK